MFNTQPKEALPPMRAGERESRAGGEQYCFSPLPLPTDSEHAVDMAHIDVRHDDVTMDLRQGASPESLMTVGHVFSGLATCILIFFLITWGAVGGFPPDSQILAVWGGGLYRFLMGVYSGYCLDQYAA